MKNKILSTKANTLGSLRPLVKKSYIEESFVFTVDDWQEKSQTLIFKIKEKFGSSTVLVRSSAVSEDAMDSSAAGAFHSELDVKCQIQPIRQAVGRVISSYQKKKSLNPQNQIFIQRQIKDIAIAGVVFTRAMRTNASYYVINYDDVTGLTNTVTGGLGGKSIKISHFTPKNLYPAEFAKLIEAVAEIEKLIPEKSLDIEFAIDKKGRVIIFQVRPIAANQGQNKEKDDAIKKQIESLTEKFSEISRPKAHLSGRFTYFADMPDWNPAEIIGGRPGHLDYSLYDYLITDAIWARARSSQGYLDVLPAKLVVLFGNKPYVDVRNTFNSFLPKDLPLKLREKLIRFYLKKLRENPHLQDKVEFEVVYTCYDFLFNEKAGELGLNGFFQEEIGQLKKTLLDLTNNLVVNSAGSIEADLNAIKTLGDKRKIILSKLNRQLPILHQLALAKQLLDDCKEYGTLPFSRLARLAFASKILLKSLMERGLISQALYDNFFASISTVATEIDFDFCRLASGQISKEEFFGEYGHLRPGTYDITSLCYNDQKNLFDEVDTSRKCALTEDFRITGALLKKISQEFAKDGLKFDGKFLLEFAKKAGQGRELSKFEFSKNLSLAIEIIAQVGKKLGFDRKQLSLLDCDTIFSPGYSSELELMKNWRKVIGLRQKEHELWNLVYLPDIIFSKDDFYVIKDYSAKPNFNTNKIVRGEIVNLNEKNREVNLKEKIVILENGDPGYDWIFTKKPLALITKYGGVASHMAIRCAEFKLPAAIGCGSVLYEKLKDQKEVILDCQKQKISFLI